VKRGYCSILLFMSGEFFSEISNRNFLMVDWRRVKIFKNYLFIPN